MTAATDARKPTSPLLDLRNVDCMELMKEFPNNHFDLAIVDPPYGIKRDNTVKAQGGFYKDWTTKNNYPVKDWDSDVPTPEYFSELARVSKLQFVCGGNYFAHMLPMARHWLVWDKLNTMPTFSDCELIWTNVKRKSVKKFVNQWNGLMCGEKNRIHPTQKPVKLYDWLLANYAEKGMKILDTHLGSGSSAIACHYAGCHLTASELDPDYFAAACERVERETAQASFL